MAKQLSSRYQAGRRAPAWRKIKPVQTLVCVIVGYTAERHGLHSLLLATLHQGILRYAGQLRRGLTRPLQADLAGRLAPLHRCQPVVSCRQPAVWVEPELYCLVQCFGWMPSGLLRYPLWRGLLSGSAADSEARSASR
jgi:bifunctional non-homologous end joining protein LigD